MRTLVALYLGIGILLGKDLGEIGAHLLRMRHTRQRRGDRFHAPATMRSRSFGRLARSARSQEPLRLAGSGAGLRLLIQA